MTEFFKLTAQYFILIPALAGLYIFYRHASQRVRIIAEMAVGGAITLAIALVANHTIHDTRPFIAGHFTPLIHGSTDNGFPSDHTLLAAFVAYLVLRYDRRLGSILFVVAAVGGAARVATGVHHMTDVIGSMVIAAIGATIGAAIVSRVYKKRRPAGERSS